MVSADRKDFGSPAADDRMGSLDSFDQAWRSSRDAGKDLLIIRKQARVPRLESFDQSRDGVPSHANQFLRGALPL
jgi:hypothetical protein